MTFLATLFLFVLLIYGIDSLVFLLFKTPYIFGSSYIRYSIIVLAGILNYLLVFRKEKFLEYYRMKMPSVFVIAIVVIVFAGSLALILYVGPRAVHK